MSLVLLCDLQCGPLRSALTPKRPRIAGHCLKAQNSLETTQSDGCGLIERREQKANANREKRYEARGAGEGREAKSKRKGARRSERANAERKETVAWAVPSEAEH